MADVTDEDVREALRELGATVETLDDAHALMAERWLVDGDPKACRWRDGTWWAWDDPTDVGVYHTAAEALAGIRAIDEAMVDADLRAMGVDPDAAVSRMRTAYAARRPSEPIPPTREQVIAHLRSLSAEAVIELLREAKVCVGWEDYDEDGVVVDDGCDDEPISRLQTIVPGTAAASCSADARWRWSVPTPDGTPGPRGTAPDLASAKTAAEDAAIAAGYRVPWRQTCS